MSLNKAQLVDAVAKDTGMKKTDVETCLKGMIEAVTNELALGGDVTLIGFGTFKTYKRSERSGINPQTKAPIKIAARTVAKFKPGKTLSDLVNSGKPKAKKAAKPAASKAPKKAPAKKSAGKKK